MAICDRCKKDEDDCECCICNECTSSGDCKFRQQVDKMQIFERRLKLVMNLFQELGFTKNKKR